MKSLTKIEAGKETEVKERPKRDTQPKEYSEYPEGSPLKTSFNDRILRELGLYDSNTEAKMSGLKGYPGNIIIGEWKFSSGGEDNVMPVYLTYAVSNVPFIPYQPAKRVSVIGHSIRTAGKWVKEDKPLIPIGKKHLKDGAINHQVSTLNAKVCYAKTEEEILMTEDDAVIISPAFAKRAEYRIIYRALEDEARPLLMRDETEQITGEEKVTKGKHLLPQYKDSEGIIDKFLYEQSEIRHSGLLIPRELMGSDKKITVDENGKDAITEMLKAQKYNIIQNGNIGIGDKLLFLSGCKGIIADVRELPDGADIMLSRLSVWNPNKESSQRGGLLKELQISGGCTMVFYQAEHLRVNATTERSKEPKLSTTLYPFLMESKKMQKELEVDNSDFKEILKMAGLELVETTTGEVKLEEIVITGDGEEKVKMFKGVYLPKFVSLYYTRQMKHKEYIIRKTGIFNALIEENRATLKRSVQTYIRALVRPTTPGIKALIAIPHTGVYDEIRVNPKVAEQLKKRVLIYREPVCERESIQSMKVISDKETPMGCIRVHPYAMRLLNGDMDGDSLYILNIVDTFFNVSIEKYKEQARKIEIKTVPKIKELKPKNITEMIENAKEWHKKSVSRAVDTSKFGERIKKGTLKTDNIEYVSKCILPFAGAIEGSLKDSKVEGKSGEKISLREAFYEVYCEEEIEDMEATALYAILIKGKVKKPAEGKQRTPGQWTPEDFVGKTLTSKQGMFYKWFKP